MQYDLLITGGEVIDPSAGLRGVMDVGIAGGKIVAVAPSLAADQARQTISAKGRLVLPGLVDMHAHVLVNGYDMGVNTDHNCRGSGVTTLCDAGSTGSSNFSALRSVLDNHVRTRVRT
jgi:dihydroorotase